MRCVVYVALVWLAWAETVFGYVRRRPTASLPQEEEGKEKEAYCECVPYYLCVNGVISTAGKDILDLRISQPTEPVINVDRCPGLIDVCCGIPPPLISSSSTTASATTTTTYSTVSLPSLPPTLPPDTPCECVGFFDCPPERLVSDGQGNTTLEFLGLSYSHSQCQDSFSLCCAVEPTSTSTPARIPTPAPTSITPQCVCVAPYLCKDNGDITVDGQGLLDVREGKGHETPSALQSGECSDPYFVCCRPPNITTLPTTTSSTVPTTTTTIATTVDVQSTSTSSDCKPESSSTEPPTTPSTIPSTSTTASPPVSCGIRNSDGIVARILGFKTGESQFGEFPWVTAVLTNAPIMGVPVNLFVGGGTLIHPRVVLTAAHKLKSVNVSYLLVRVGEWDTQKEQEPYPHQNIKVDSVLVHPNYQASTLFYDAALLFLEEAVVLGPHVNTLCPAENLDAVDTTACVINGWGVDAFDMGEYQRVMKSLTLPLMPRPGCVQSLRRTRLGRYFRLHPSFLCAGGEKGKDACKGDGGGPLSCPKKGGEAGQHLLVGVTAWGIGCGEDGVPGVYVNVPFLHSWITESKERFLPTTTTYTTLTTTTAFNTTDKPQVTEWHPEVTAARRGARRRQEERSDNVYA